MALLNRFESTAAGPAISENRGSDRSPSEAGIGPSEGSTARLSSEESADISFTPSAPASRAKTKSFLCSCSSPIDQTSGVTAIADTVRHSADAFKFEIKSFETKRVGDAVRQEGLIVRTSCFQCGGR